MNESKHGRAEGLAPRPISNYSSRNEVVKSSSYTKLSPYKVLNGENVKCLVPLIIPPPLYYMYAFRSGAYQPIHSFALYFSLRLLFFTYSHAYSVKIVM